MVMEIDPVCGMRVDTRIPAAKSEHEGITYFFCSVGCKGIFDQDPDKYSRLYWKKRGMDKPESPEVETDG